MLTVSEQVDAAPHDAAGYGLAGVAADGLELQATVHGHDEIDLGLLADEPQCIDLNRLTIEGQLDGAGITKLIVEEPHVELLADRSGSPRDGARGLHPAGSEDAGREVGCRGLGPSRFGQCTPEMLGCDTDLPADANRSR